VFTAAVADAAAAATAATVNFFWTSDETRSAPKNGALGPRNATPSVGRLDGFPYHRVRARPIDHGNIIYFCMYNLNNI